MNSAHVSWQKIAMRLKRITPTDLLDHARDMRKFANQPKAERLLWYLLRARRLEGLRFRRQQPIGRYVVDFYCHDARLAVEADGGGHVEWKTERYDRRRSRFLASLGVHVLRFWNNEILGQTDDVLEEIRRVALERIEKCGFDDDADPFAER